ncbi:MAG: hypothetical protein H0X66_04565 [Verrucomicrobia bacterium]|nr:hypothetical protein [Verrucomicrobiota bacterium]
MKKLMVLAAAALLAVNINTQAAISLPPGPVCFSSGPYPSASFSYLDLTLSGVPAGYSVGNNTYPGWCVEAYNFEFSVGAQYCGAILRLSTDAGLPSHLQSIPWGIVNYILNNKQGTPEDVQNAIWWFTDGWPVTPAENTAAYQSLLAAAASQGSFVPGSGDVVAVVLDLGAVDAPQIMIIEVPVPQEEPGVGTPGYWKNHPGAWPVANIVLGGVSYTKQQAINIMQNPIRNDKTYNLAEQLIAAKLNVAVGNESSCIADTIANADAFLSAFPIGSGVRGSSTAWQTLGEDLLTELTAYNEGLLCAPSRD